MLHHCARIATLVLVVVVAAGGFVFVANLGSDDGNSGSSTAATTRAVPAVEAARTEVELEDRGVQVASLRVQP